MRSMVAALLVLVAAGCGCRDKVVPKDANVVARLDDHHVLAAPVTVGNLTVWPIVTDRPLDLGEFLTLDEALAKGAAEVREVGANLPTEAEWKDAAGQPDRVGQELEQLEEPPQQPGADAPAEGTETQEETQGQQEQTLEPVPQVAQVLNGSSAMVNTLVIENKGDLPILVCAGTVVKGGNQDRQIGQDFVLKAKSTTPVDAFCVEQGRWTSDRLGEETGGKFQVLEGMATAKVRAKGQYEKDQSGVWQEVADVQQASFGVTNFGPATETTSFAATFDANAKASSEDLKRCEDALRARFAGQKDAVGFAYAINGKPVAVRTFAHPRLLAKSLDDFVRGMATEALLAKSETPAKQAQASDVVALVKSLSAAEETVAETAGLNRNGLRANDAGYNGSCYVADKDGKLAPLTQDWTAK
jgi:hypothetical protein